MGRFLVYGCDEGKVLPKGRTVFFKAHDQTPLGPNWLYLEFLTYEYVFICS